LIDRLCQYAWVTIIIGSRDYYVITVVAIWKGDSNKSWRANRTSTQRREPFELIQDEWNVDHQQPLPWTRADKGRSVERRKRQRLVVRSSYSPRPATRYSAWLREARIANNWTTSQPSSGRRSAHTHTHIHTHTQNTLDVHSRTMNGERTTADNRNDGARVHDFSGFSDSSFVAITTNEAKRKTGVGRLAETSAGKVASDHRCAAASVKNGLH